MMITSNLPPVLLATLPTYDTNAYLTQSDQQLIEFNSSNNLYEAEAENPQANLLAIRIGQDRHDGVLTGDVTQSYIENLLNQSLAQPNGKLPVAILYKALSYFNPPTGLSKGEFYVEGRPAYFGNDLLTAGDKQVVEAAGGSSDLLTAEHNSNVSAFASDIAEARSLGILTGEMTPQFVDNLLQQQQEIQREIRSGIQRAPDGTPTTVSTIDLSVLNTALSYLDGEQVRSFTTTA